ncbi:methyltransferase [Acuticoccus sp. I52.16.1]|uniref:class I SAM-dependent methyltransferase n=1 Tax=Acuticoccus sp. I52.16.1 TaxID=2928472 RepID=UPI001FD5091C|nr:methyltransferase [Acuticoccus sp. I52.16.1]UOM32554.1 methyltransferase [Acuticoccus sp. I52.16.1]
MDRIAFIRANTAVSAATHVPEVRLHLADEALPLWHKTEEKLGEEGLPPPFWAFAWAGGQALARYLIDNPALVAGRRVLDIGAGGGLVAIAAARSGAHSVRANEIDAFALDAIGLNAALNEVAVEIVAGDLLGGTAEADVVLAGDIFYERPLAERALAFLHRAKADGADVLIGDPKRTYLPVDALRIAATYEVAVPRALEDSDVKLTRVWRLA